MRKPILLWVGDAACASGFARATHYTLETLRQHYDVTVLGLNSFGDPRAAQKYPYPIWPCYPDGDMFGVNRLMNLIPSVVNPDIIVIQNDPWNFPNYMKAIRKVTAAPVVGAVAVDGLNCQGHLLNDLALAIFWTEFGEKEARKGGYTGQSAVVPLGVDLNIYKPMDRKEARLMAGLPFDMRDVFLVGNVNRNQPRKRMDLTVSFFCEWVKEYKIDDAYLYLHIAPTADDAYDAGQLMAYYGFKGKNIRLLQSHPEVLVGLPEERLARLYCAFDVMLTTTQGEGMGLTTLEGMACGVPQIVPDWSALGDWAAGYAMLMPCGEIAVTPTMQRSKEKINVIGGIPNRAATIEALDDVYRNHNDERTVISNLGLLCANQPKYRWENIGAEFFSAMTSATGVGAAEAEYVDG